MAKDKKKKKDPANKEAKAAKQAAKTNKTEKKLTKRAKDDDSDAEDADLDAILAAYQKQQEQFLKVTESPCESPKPRSSATLVPSPTNSSELFLFGGEYFNGAVASFFNDLYVYKINQDSWRRVTSPNTPLPRSGHAMCKGDNSGGIYMFGGEFSSPKQGTFYHYNDFWRLEPSTREWTKLEGKGGPPARSGHRMTSFKNYIVLFGGFQDTSQQTKYLQDVWLYDTQRYVWHAVNLPTVAQKPDARSSFSLLPHETGAVIYGGYSRIKATTAVRSTKAGKSGSRVTMNPVVHQDTWYLRITPPAPDAAVNTPPAVRWERRKRPANSLNPARAGATMAHHKGRGITFGGVHDVEESEEGIDSEFFNSLYAYNIDRNRFFQLSLRRPRASGKKAVPASERGKRGRGKADEEELLRNLAIIEGKGSLNDDTDMPDAPSKDADEEDDEPKVEKPTMWEFPHPRFNAQLAVQEDTLYIFGGTFEKGDREFTFDEMWAIDLGKLDGVKEVFKRDLEDWLGSEDEEDSDEDDEDGSDEDDEDEDEGTEPSTPAKSVADEQAATAAAAAQAEADANEQETTTAPDDKLPMPRPFETLREFFSRTNNEWQEVVLEKRKYEQNPTDRSIKEIRKKAFDQAEQKWWDVREDIQALEDEQEAAGISEVVSLAERGGGAEGGAARRR